VHILNNKAANADAIAKSDLTVLKIPRKNYIKIL
jgi:hypothetical protein